MSWEDILKKSDFDKLKSHIKQMYERYWFRYEDGIDFEDEFKILMQDSRMKTVINTLGSMPIGKTLSLAEVTVPEIISERRSSD